MEKGNYPLIVTPDITLNLFENPIIRLDGESLKDFIPFLVRQNKEYSPVVLDKGFGLVDIDCGEYVSGERKTLSRLKELTYDEVDRRMGKIAIKRVKNFFEYNALKENDKIEPRIIIFAGARITRISEKSIKRLSVFAKMTGLFPIYCYPTESDISNSLLASASLAVYARNDRLYVVDFYNETRIKSKAVPYLWIWLITNRTEWRKKEMIWWL